MKGDKMRPKLVKLAGVNIVDPHNIFIGENVTFDSLCPENITIEKFALVTAGCSFLTHYISPLDRKCTYGKIIIKENAIVGWGTIICKPVTIGKNSVVGAGSVVTDNNPDNEVWAGNPARFIKKVNPKDFFDKAKLNL